MQIIGSTFMKKFLINYFILTALFCFISCKRTEYVLFSSDELLSFCEEHENYKSYLKKKNLIVTGKIAWISYPKDGRALNECAVYLETAGCNPKERSGNFISCHAKKRLSKSCIGKNVMVKGIIENYEVLNNEKFVTVKVCQINLNDDL